MITVQDTDFFLVQFSGKAHETLHGPFATRALAWRYLFGRDPTDQEIKYYEECSWEVRPAVEDET